MQNSLAGFWLPPPGGARGQLPPLPPLATPLISMWLDTHIHVGLNRPHFLTYYFIFHVICSL